MRPGLFTLCALSLVVGCSAHRPRAAVNEPTSAAASYLDEAIDIIRANALYRDSVDWQRLRADAHTWIRGSSATTYSAYPAIRHVLRSLGDNHSFLQLSDSLQQLERRHAGTPGRTDPGAHAQPPSPYGSRMQPEGRVIDARGARIGFVFMPQGRRDDAFATRFAAMVDTIGRANVCGWIVDLRGNGGGDMWPMLAGIGSLLGEGEVGGWVHANGRSERHFYRDGRSIARDTTGAEHVRSAAAAPPAPVSRDVPVAVLLDRGTASSGEVLAIAFRGRPNTRLFGEPSFGATTATRGFQLPDGANLVIAIATLSDAQGRTYSRNVTPDEHVASGTVMPDQDSDAAIGRATEWIAAGSRCG
jgi:carboxyl-terminal processing protease